MIASLSRIASVLALAVISVPLAAQRPVLARARGLATVEGVLRGAARDYKIEFRAGGIEYTCPLGADAPRSLPLSFELESIRVGATELVRSAHAQPQQDELRVRYDHGGGLHELYEIRADGVEQSFVLDALPSARGELVVRGRIATDLELPSAGEHAGGVEFRAADRGGVRIGEVLGIDATGRTARGLLRFDGAAVEYVLPADFVDTAALPLVVDPLIGSILTPFSAADSGDPDAAYSDASDEYLVAFERQWSGTDVDVYAQRITGAGALVGGLLLLESSVSPLAINPTVAFVSGPNAWFVAWQQGSNNLGPWDVAGKAINASGAFTPSSLLVASTSANEIDPDAWGPVQPLGPSAIVVWDAHGAGIRGAKVTVTSTPSASLLFGFTVSTDGDDSKPTISRGGTSSALIAWQRLFSFPPPGDSDIAGLVLTSNAIGFVTLTPVATLLTTVGPDERDIDVDGNGVDFALAYERRSTSDAADSDVHCLRAKFSSIPNTVDASGDPVAITTDASHAELDPAIGFLGPKYAVAWSRSIDGLDFDVRMRLIDPADCTACDGAELALAAGAGYQGRVEIATRRAAKAAPSAVSDDQALAVWETSALTLPFDGDIQAQRLEALGAGGSIVNIGGKCGGGGVITYNGPASIGNPAVVITLTGADPAAAVGFINTVFGGTPITCGACVWEPFSPLVTVRPVSGGNATYVSPVPCDAALLGVTLRYQWTVAFTSTSPCPLSANVSLSDRLDVTYGE